MRQKETINGCPVNRMCNVPPVDTPTSTVREALSLGQNSCPSQPRIMTRLQKRVLHLPTTDIWSWISHHLGEGTILHTVESLASISSSPTHHAHRYPERSTRSPPCAKPTRLQAPPNVRPHLRTTAHQPQNRGAR